MLNHFSLVLIFALVGAAFLFLSLFAGKFFRPNKPNQIKSQAYECGEEAVGPAWISFNIRFYLIALIFVIFDVEAALMFPAATVFKKWIGDGKGILAFSEIALFVLILFVGLVYVWKKKDLDWIKK